MIDFAALAAEFDALSGAATPGPWLFDKERRQITGKYNNGEDGAEIVGFVDGYGYSGELAHMNEALRQADDDDGDFIAFCGTHRDPILEALKAKAAGAVA